MGEMYLRKPSLLLHQAQELIKKDGGEMLVSIVLDRPLDEAKALVEDPDRLISEITAILESKQAHPLLNQMVNPDVRDDMPIADFTAASSSRRFGPPRSTSQAEVPQSRFQWRDRSECCRNSGASLKFRPRITNLDNATRQLHHLSCILDSCTITASYEVSQAQKSLLLPRTEKGSSEEHYANLTELTHEDVLQEH